MCKYVNGKECSLSKEQCPYMYFCTRTNSWQPSKAMPNQCPVMLRAEAPEGYYRVCDVRHGNLYVDIEGYIKIIKNPFEDVPLFVRAIKSKSGKWYVKK